MFNDSFKLRYQSAPLAIYERKDFNVTLPHIHNEIEVLYIEQGKTDVKISDIVFVNPLEVHTLIPHKNSQYVHKCICFDTSLIADKRVCDSLIKGDLKITYNINAKEELADCFFKIYDAVKQNEDTLMFESTEYISRMFLHLIKNGYLNEEKKSKKNEKFCFSVMEYIKNNFNNQITSQDVAEEFFYTQSYFCRIFNKNFGRFFIFFV